MKRTPSVLDYAILSDIGYNIDFDEEINLKNVEIESLKLSLNEAHEVSAMLFTEGMEITERYTELKKAKAKKCGR